MNIDDESDFVPADDIELDDDLEADEPEQQDDDQTDEEGDGEVEDLIGFEDEDPLPVEPESPTIKHLREKLKARDKLINELNAKVPKIEAGPKPTLESCDYDEDKYDTLLLAWNQRKAEEEAQNAASPPNTSTREDFDREHAEYTQQKAKISRPDFAAAEATVIERFDDVRQGILVTAAKNKAALVYALGKSPARLDALEKITNPIKFALAVADMERSLKVQARKKAPAPESRMKGGTPAPKATTVNKAIDKATEGGDVTEQLRLMRAARNKS